MDSMGKIGIIMPEITDPLDYELLDSIYGQAEKLGYDVIVFTGVLNSMSDEKRDYYTEDFENIYSIICKSSLDGLIFAADRFRNEGLIQMTGKKCESLGNLQTIRYGTSCGCSYETAAAQSGFLDSLHKKVSKLLFCRFEKKSFLGVDFISKMSDAEDIETLMDTVDNAGHILNGWKWIDIALCEDWQSNLDNPCNFRQHSFSEKMYLALSKRYGENDKSEYYYSTSEILPAFGKPHEPMITVLTSLHCKGQIFGYIAMAFDSHDDIELDDYFVKLSALLGNSALIPELFTGEYEISGRLPSEIERSVDDDCSRFFEIRSIELSKNYTYRKQIYSLRREIMTQPQLDWNIPDISKDLGISKTHLQRLYKELFSTSIKDDIILSHMNRAMQLLARTDLRVQEIAEQCGYNNENHFMRQFKEKNGMTALQYRKNNG